MLFLRVAQFQALTWNERTFEQEKKSSPTTARKKQLRYTERSNENLSSYRWPYIIRNGWNGTILIGSRFKNRFVHHPIGNFSIVLLSGSIVWYFSLVSTMRWVCMRYTRDYRQATTVPILRGISYRFSYRMQEKRILFATLWTGTKRPLILLTKDTSATRGKQICIR